MISWLRRKAGPPDAADVMKRAIILKCLIVRALAVPPDEFLQECRAQWSEEEWNSFVSAERSLAAENVRRLHDERLWGQMDADERNFMEAPLTDVTPQARIDASWLAEGAMCLLWALGFVAEILPYDRQAEVELTNTVPKEPVLVLVKKAELRSAGLIEKQRSVAELWHWRARTRQLQESGQVTNVLAGKYTVSEVLQISSRTASDNGDCPPPIDGDFPAFGKAYRDLTKQEFSAAMSIAMERHRAFNWLCGYAPGNRWSETPTDT